MNNFVELHRLNINLAIELLRCALQRRGADLDPLRHSLAFTLGYRANSDGNPATLLFIRKIELVEGNPGAEETQVAREGADGHRDSAPPAGEPRLEVVFRGGGASVSAWTTLMPIDPVDKLVLALYSMDWIGHLRFVTTIGAIFEKPSGSDPSVWVMHKKGGKWRRRRATEEECSRVFTLSAMDTGSEPVVEMGSLSAFLRRP